MMERGTGSSAAISTSGDVGTARRGLTRRQLFALGVAGAVAPFAVGCGQRAATAPPDVAATPAVGERQPLGTPIYDLATPTVAPASPTATAPPATPRARPPLLTTPRFRLQDLAATNNLSPDGYTWAQGNPIIVDRHDRIIALVQRISREGEALIFTNQFVYSNNGGTIWREATPAIEGVSRASLAYDDENDILHALWRGQNPAQGIGYRRYRIERDPQGNIVRFSPDPLGAVVLDAQHDGALMTYEHPTIVWLTGGEVGNRYGAVLCVWSARNAAPGSPGNEVRASMRPLANDGSDAESSGWIAPVAPATTTIGSPPTVAYSALVANQGAGQVYPSVGRARAGRHRGDLYLFYADGGATGGGESWCWRRFAWMATERRWRIGTPETTISPIARTGRDRGYELKGQLGSKIVDDPQGGRHFFGFTTWKDDIAGDTWNIVAVDDDDRVGPLVDVYSCQGRFQPELYALTGDIVFDDASKSLVVAYIHTGLGTNFGCLRVYDGTAPLEPETIFFTAADVDIPLLWQDARTGRCRYGSGLTTRLLVLFRDTNGQAPPYRGWFGTLDWRAER